MSTFSDEFIDAEIERLETEVAEASKAYNAAVADAIEKQEDGDVRRYYLPYSDPLYSELRRVQNALGDWKWQKQKREQTRFVKRVTTFPEEIHLTNHDLYFWDMCHRLERLQEKDLPQNTILDGVKLALKLPFRSHDFWMACARAQELHHNGMTKATILKNLKIMFDQEETNWTDELITEQTKSSDAETERRLEVIPQSPGSK